MKVNGKTNQSRSPKRPCVANGTQSGLTATLQELLGLLCSPFATQGRSYIDRVGPSDISGHLSPIIRPMRLISPRRRQRWQPIRRPRIITAGVMHPTLPRSIKLAARAGTVGINGTSHLFANLASKADTAAGLGIGADHGNAGGVDLYYQVVRYNAPGRLAFAPEEGHTEVPAAGAAVKARVIFGHEATEGRLLLSGLSPRRHF